MMKNNNKNNKSNNNKKLNKYKINNNKIFSQLNNLRILIHLKIYWKMQKSQKIYN